MLKNDISIAPFLGDSNTLSVGLNPLGIRTASEQLFTTLLPGLNVVTLRIRYYSFYCWLLKCFYANRKEAKRFDLQRHIRMSELLMALIHAQSNNDSGVPGITRASDIIKKGQETIDFNEDAMPKGKPTGGYWKGSFGAFGTYYAASLQEMGIILPLVDNTKLYNVTPKTEDYISGEELADAFAETVGDSMGMLFNKCAEDGVVTRQQLASMEPFFQSHNMPNNKEREILLKMLLQNERPRTLKESKFRKESFRLLLRFLNDTQVTKFTELNFAKYVYDCFSKGIENSNAAAGWYAYYLNDNRQYEALNIFGVVLKRLLKSKKPGQWENIDDFTSLLTDDVCASLNVDDMTINDVLENWDSINDSEKQMAHAFYILFDDYRKNPKYQECKKVIKAYFHVNNDALDSFDIIGSHINEPIRDYIKHYLIENVIYNHYSESMRKYSQNGVPTQKLTIENGYVRGLTTYTASHSSPRIDTLRNFAVDLGLIDDHKLTPNGVELLSLLQND